MKLTALFGAAALAAASLTTASPAEAQRYGYGDARGYGYGAGWWTFPADAGLPDDAFVAQGNRGQYVVVVPSRQVVIVRRGFDSTGARFDPAALTRDVLAALR